MNWFSTGSQLIQPDLTAIRTYYMRWIIRTTSLVQIQTVFAKSYVFYELLIHINLYEWPTPNPTQIVQNGTSEVVRISHLVKYEWIGHEIALG